MRKQLPYIQGYPLIQVVLIGPKDKIKMLALLDSGADYSLFSLEVAEKLRIPVEKGKRISLQGVAGQPFTGFLHEVPVQVEDTTLKCKIVFSKVRATLLGRDNFFLPFLITFNEKHQKVIVEKQK